MNALITLEQRRAIIDRITVDILAGTSLRYAIRDSGIDALTFNKWLQADKEAAMSYARAQEFRADLLADDIIDIADNSEDAGKARNQITSRQWYCGKLNQRKYGDRIDLNVTQSLDITSALAEARARSLPVRDQPITIEGQAVDLTNTITNGSTDNQSVRRPSAEDVLKVPSIFD